MSKEPLITLFDIITTKGAFSPFAWRVRLALNYKKINYKTHWLALTDIKSNHQRFSIPETEHPIENPFYTIPAIIDASTSPPIVISQSFNIEKYLDEKYPDPPLYSIIPPNLHQGDTNAKERVAFLDEVNEFLRETNHWRRKILIPLAIPLIPNILQEQDKDYFYESRSRWFQMPFNEISPKAEAREVYIKDLKAVFEELDRVLVRGRVKPYNPNDQYDKPWICGDVVTRGDFTLIGLFIWIQKSNPELWNLIKTWNSGRWLSGGPSGFYLAARILYLLSSPGALKGNNINHNQDNLPVRVHIFERLKAPHGLVRFGVAPDHPEVKNCIHKFDRVVEDPKVRFFGNVHVGGGNKSTGSTSTTPSSSASPLHLPLSTLFPYYTHLAFSTGAPIPKTHPRLPPSQYCIPALDIVHWYTGHPESRYSDLTPPIPPSAKHITIIGHGNVSLDVARMILSSFARLNKLSDDDMPPNIKRAMKQLNVEHIDIVGRRGPEDVRFTPKEVREMMSLDNVAMNPIPNHLFERMKLDSLSRQQTRIVQLLQKGSRTMIDQSPRPKTFKLQFFEQPVGYRVVAPGLIELELEETCLTTSGDVVPVSPPRRRVIHTNLIVTSLGYESSPGLFQNSEQTSYPWFNERTRHIRSSSAGGRVLSPDGRVVQNIYASGWAGRGAHGVLAGTVMDANDVAASIIQDWEGEELRNGEVIQQNIGSKIGHVERLPSPLAIEPAGGLYNSCDVIENGVRDGIVSAYHHRQ
ncbi:hypothetical protein Clacol_007418 [Clathrus columnatus]|uniref:GST N-terminal domain-containing protein n=1 Tax=Clathrus columnatus TaxID=1419009 RepID=A0AAV5AHP1_9AGAM|nr:hypothetical protein Clacol_007418 [Clathrus columnatus]